MPTYTPITDNAAAYDYMERKRGVNGKQQRALALKRESLKAALRANGSAKEASVLNFNPLPLRLESGISYKVPSVVDESVPDQSKLRFKHKGKEYACTYLAIPEPFLYPIIRDVTLPQGADPADGIGIYDVLPCRQIEIAHLFWAANNNGDKSELSMGGVVIFEGDKHVLKNALKGEDVQINVPEFIQLPDHKREYYTTPKSFQQVFAGQIERQRNYCLNEMQTASLYNNIEEQRKSITQVMRIWHQYALTMGYVQHAEPWLMTQNEPEETCEGCGAGKKRATAFFCHACARPYSPLESYMAGELGIDSVHMNRIKEADWAVVRKEEARRKSLREGPKA